MSKRDQYHHYIPRFILREFQTGAKKTNKERQEEFKKTGVVNERVYFYDLTTQRLENRLIGTVYGVTNLYRDITNIQRVDEVEEKFSALEGHCAKLIQGLHKRLDGSATERRTFPITRQDLGQLRKFLFLMHFRNSGLQGSYFDPEHPHHRGVRDVLEKRWAQAAGAKSPKDVWLHALKYYLDTPHSQILLQVAQKAPAEADIITLLSSLNPHTLENAELMDAITYHQQADLCYLSVIQAAPGHEFVLGNNTFGLWEGVVGEGATAKPGIHRIYVASPRVALILRLRIFSSGMRSPQRLKDTNSDIISIHLPTPSCTFAFNGSEGFLSMAQYRASPAAQNDLFTFPITKLTVSQTFLINAVVLQNIDLLGSLTFKDPSCMRITLRQFWRLDIPLNRFMRLKYASLMNIIGLAMCSQSEDFDVPLTRVFVPSGSGDEAEVTSIAAVNKAAARKKKKKAKGKGASGSVGPVQTLSDELPQVEAPRDRLMTLATKRIYGTIPNTRERYDDSLEAWTLMHLDTPPEETAEADPYRNLFHITAARFKKLGEPFLLTPCAPGFAPAPNAQLKGSTQIASDATIKAIFDSGGKWFDEWEAKFCLHVGDENLFEEMTGIRNTKHLLRDLLIIEVITWLARNRRDILQHVVICDVDMSLYIST